MVILFSYWCFFPLEEWVRRSRTWNSLLHPNSYILETNIESANHLFGKEQVSSKTPFFFWFHVIGFSTPRPSESLVSLITNPYPWLKKQKTQLHLHTKKHISPPKKKQNTSCQHAKKNYPFPVYACRSPNWIPWIGQEGFQGVKEIPSNQEIFLLF